MKRGFTLIELLVVTLIFGILAAVAVPQYRLAVQRVKFSRLQTMAEQLFQAQQAYYLTNGRYTADYDALDIEMPPRPGPLVDMNGTEHPYPPPPYPYEVEGLYLAGNGDIFIVQPRADGVLVAASREDLPAAFMLVWAWERFKIRACNADGPEGEKLCRAAGARLDDGQWLF